MKKNPVLMALSVLGGLLAFFLVIVLTIAGLAGAKGTLVFGERIGVVQIAGVIDSSHQIIEDLLAFREDESVRAVVLRIDSPGGGVGPSQEIHNEVKKLAATKPVVVSMGSVAASGGYYVAAPAHQIVANPGTLTGSIGVIMEFTSFQELLEKIGLESQVVKSGEHKDIGSLVRPLSAGDREILQSVIDDVHGQFVGAVAEGRRMAEETVRSLADGRVFTGQQALDAGLVDRLGNLQDSIDVAAELGGIQGEPAVIYPSRRKPGFLDYLLQETVSGLRQGLQQEFSPGLQFLWSDVH